MASHRQADFKSAPEDRGADGVDCSIAARPYSTCIVALELAGPGTRQLMRHWRSSPDNTPTNNYSYPGNTNPFTGKTATGDPYTYVQRYELPRDPYAITPRP